MDSQVIRITFESYFLKTNAKIFLGKNRIFSGRITTEYSTGVAKVIEFRTDESNLPLLITIADHQKNCSLNVDRGKFIAVRFSHDTIIVEQFKIPRVYD